MDGPAMVEDKHVREVVPGPPPSRGADRSNGSARWDTVGQVAPALLTLPYCGGTRSAGGQTP